MKILFVHNALRSFVRIDRDILASAHDVDELDVSASARITSWPARLAQADMVYAWFASRHSLASVVGAAILGKPSVVVVGGYDTACLPEIGYGSMAHPVKRHVVRGICTSASALIANSESAAAEVRTNVPVSTPLYVCHHGFSSSLASPGGARQPIVLTVGNISRESLRRKGHEVFVRAAALVPDARFVLVGQCFDDAIERLRAIAPPNVEIAGYLEQSSLDSLLSQTSVYVQVSAHEGFGCALAEAMLWGCAPVISRKGALLEVAGEYGLCADENDPADVADAIRLALPTSSSRRENIAARIRERFPLERRHTRLLQIVAECARGAVRQVV